MTMPAFSIGEIIESDRARLAGSSAIGKTATARRFVVHGVSAAGFLYVHPFGQKRARWNEYLVAERDARRPAPGELSEEWGR